MHCIKHQENEVYVDILYCVLQHCRYLDILQWQQAAWCGAVRQLEHGNFAAYSLSSASILQFTFTMVSSVFRNIDNVKRSIYPANRCYVRYDLILFECGHVT